ncbi:MAG: ribosome maturation factor RimM [Proteobacteria bacterium]|nr:ribosome maturation factor RimM [Pseudomonadota bacterium]NOG59198.1 ribosome maturation factor RimM [Pseudomonadota bacterium]
MQQVKSRIVVGRIGGAHGVRGWIKIMSYTRPKENIFTYSPWLIHVNGQWQEFEIEDAQQRGERLLVKFSDINSPEGARIFLNCDIAIKREQLPDLDEGQYYWHDLIGLDVFNQDQVNLGRISEITETGANDVLVVRQKGENKSNILIPLVMDVYVKQVDLDANKMQVDWHFED